VERTGKASLSLTFPQSSFRNPSLGEFDGADGDQEHDGDVDDIVSAGKLQGWVYRVWWRA
jgi:hypothetical protein